MALHPNYRTEQDVKDSDDRKIFWAGLAITVVIALACYTHLFGDSQFWIINHINALARDTTGIPWNHIGSVAGLIVFAAGPVGIWLGAHDRLPDWAGKFMPNGAIWYLLCLGFGIALSAGFQFRG